MYAVRDFCKGVEYPPLFLWHRASRFFDVEYIQVFYLVLIAGRFVAVELKRSCAFSKWCTFTGVLIASYIIQHHNADFRIYEDLSFMHVACEHYFDNSYSSVLLLFTTPSKSGPILYNFSFVNIQHVEDSNEQNKKLIQVHKKMKKSIF